MANIELADFTVDQNGNLVISKKPGIAYTFQSGNVDTYEQEYEEIDAMQCSDDYKFSELIEYQICNGWGYTNNASYFGALSETSLIWDDTGVEEDEHGSITEIKHGWYDNMYMIRSAWKEFLNTGKVTFTYFDNSE